MLIDRFADDLVVWAPAKVNLYLELLGKRADGYHELATLLVAVRLYDTLVFKNGPAGELHLSCSDPGLTTGFDNLVMRAACLLLDETGGAHGASIRLIKRIPMAAGLAGGSSDAAATLAGLNELWRLGLSQDRLSDLGGRLGSDVPFFFRPPAAWCTGRGEKVEALKLGRRLEFVVVCPPVGLSTAEVYRHSGVPPEPQTGDAIRRAIEAGEVEEIGRHLFNRLQPAAEELCPAVAKIHARLAELAPAGQLMSGSGSSVFALCRDGREAQRIARQLHQLRSGADEEGMRIFQVRSCS